MKKKEAKKVWNRIFPLIITKREVDEIFKRLLKEGYNFQTEDGALEIAKMIVRILEKEEGKYLEGEED